jgi:ammonium transporter, Amt family
MTDQLVGLQTIFTEFYYWVTVALMFLIHVGFCMYEVGASRNKNKFKTLMKNTMVIPPVTITFFLFGWWIYWAFPPGIPGVTGDYPEIANTYLPWSENMGTHMQDRITGVFWAAFLLFSWTAASIVSGALIERVRSGAFWLMAVLIGSVTWIIDAAWGWHSDGWMVLELGYHDAYASGVIHAIAGGAALGALCVLGPRIGKFRADGSARTIVPNNPWLVTIGIFLIYTGFWGFYVACNVPIIDSGFIGSTPEGGATFWTATTIYYTPTTLSAITFNFIMSLSGGLMVGYLVSKGDPFWTYSLGLTGIITASAGNDLYHPIQSLIIGGVGAWAVYKLHYWVERKFKIDDAVGAVAVHGYGGFLGVVIAGFVLWGAPATAGYHAETTAITPWGNFIGAVIMFFVLGFLPMWILAKILSVCGLLRVPREVELAGLDLQTNHLSALDEAEVSEATVAALQSKN